MLYRLFADDNIDETYGVNVQFESDEEVSFSMLVACGQIRFFVVYALSDIIVLLFICRRVMRISTERFGMKALMTVREKRQMRAAH